jgi:leucyl-tRNA synthetase
MPWCETCERMVADEELSEGNCPTCDEPLEERRTIPWHFKLLLLATVVYLGYRAYQGIAWVVHHV